MLSKPTNTVLETQLVLAKVKKNMMMMMMMMMMMVKEEVMASCEERRIRGV
jgi:hypothetical protein